MTLSAAPGPPTYDLLPLYLAQNTNLQAAAEAVRDVMVEYTHEGDLGEFIEAQRRLCNVRTFSVVPDRRCDKSTCMLSIRDVQRITAGWLHLRSLVQRRWEKTRSSET